MITTIILTQTYSYKIKNNRKSIFSLFSQLSNTPELQEREEENSAARTEENTEDIKHHTMEINLGIIESRLHKNQFPPSFTRKMFKIAKTEIYKIIRTKKC